MMLFQGLKNYLRELKIDKNNLEPGNYLVKAANGLLETKYHQEQITMMRSFLESAQDFSLVYEPILNQFAEFVQNLPETKLGFFGRESEFLTQGLERVTRTMRQGEHCFPQCSPCLIEGGIGLFALITSPLLHKELSVSLQKSNEVISSPLSPTQKL